MIPVERGDVIGVVTHEEDRHYGRWWLRVEAAGTELAERQDQPDRLQM